MKAKLALGKKKTTTSRPRDYLREFQNDDGRSIPEEVVVNLRDFTVDDLIALVEMSRYKGGAFSYLALSPSFQSIKLPENVAQITRRRLSIDAGKFEDSLSLGSKAIVGNPRLALQKIRALCFTGHFLEAKTMCEDMLNDRGIPLINLGDIHQIYGQCLMELGQLELSLTHLNEASHIANLYQSAHGIISANLFLVKAFCFLGKLTSAKNAFLSASHFVSPNNESFRWMLGYYRTWGFLLYVLQDPRFEDKMKAAQHLAKSIGDSYYSTKCEIELHMMKYPHQKMQIREQNLSDDLKMWINVAQGLPAPSPAPTSLTFLAALSRQRNLQPVQTDSLSVDEPYWMFDVDTGWLFDLKNKIHYNVPPDSPSAKLIEILGASSSGVSSQTAFEGAWGLKWNEHLHDGVLKMATGRINKKQSTFTICRENKMLYVKFPGIVISKRN